MCLLSLQLFIFDYIGNKQELNKLWKALVNFEITVEDILLENREAKLYKWLGGSGTFAKEKHKHSQVKAYKGKVVL